MRLAARGFASAARWAAVIVPGMAAALLISGAGCGSRPEPARVAVSGETTGPPKVATAGLRVREPAVAGLFYPGQAKVLSATVEELLAAAPERRIARLKGLVCPHAGYEYSGRTAASAYKLLAGRQIHTVLILAASHYAGFHGVSVPNVDAYRTPLGLVPISTQAADLGRQSPFVLEPRCAVQRPPWWQQRPKTAPAFGEDTPETWEHAVEVQVPFLQKTLKEFKLLPIVFGDASPEQVARAVAARLDDQTLVVASSDLSHYHPYAEARALDESCVKAICDLDFASLESQEACGKPAILTLMHLARQKGWKAQLLDCRNSGDVTGEKDRVVGYAAIAFYEPAEEAYSDADRQWLLGLARRTVSAVAGGGDPPEVPAGTVSPLLTEAKGCFVTLTIGGELRGCIGHIVPQEPLYRAIVDNARSAASRDPRFPPVRPDEVKKIKIEISVLTVPQPLSFSSPEDLLAKLQPGQDGVVLQIGGRGATFLPQVWEQIPGKADFLNQLSRKAGCDSAAWRGKETSVSTYHVESFAESE